MAESRWEGTSSLGKGPGLWGNILRDLFVTFPRLVHSDVSTVLRHQEMRQRTAYFHFLEHKQVEAILFRWFTIIPKMAADIIYNYVVDGIWKQVGPNKFVQKSLFKLCEHTQPQTTSAFFWVLCLSIVGTLELRASGLDVDSDIDRFVTKQDTWNQTMGIVWCRTVLKCPSFEWRTLRHVSQHVLECGSREQGWYVRNQVGMFWCRYFQGLWPVLKECSSCLFLFQVASSSSGMCFTCPLTGPSTTWSRAAGEVHCGPHIQGVETNGVVLWHQVPSLASWFC